MKRIRDIFEEMIAFDTLYRAYLKLKKKGNKRHKRRIKRFEENLYWNLWCLHFSLKNGTWRMHKYKHMFRMECGKMREIYYSSNFSDLIVQCAIGMTLGAKLNHSLIEDTYAGIPGKSLHKGMRRIFRRVRAFGNKPIFCYKIDFKQFYSSIDHDKLKEALMRKVKDKRAVGLIFNIIDNCPIKVGLPIGNLISPILANFFLNPVDRLAKNMGLCYYRYNDDIVAFCDSKDKIHEFQNALHALAVELKVNIKKNEQVFPIERLGIDLMGFIVQRKRVLVRRRIERHVRRNAMRFKLHPSAHRARSLSSQWGWFKRVKSGKAFWFKNVGCSIKNFNKMVKALCVTQTTETPKTTTTALLAT